MGFGLVPRVLFLPQFILDRPLTSPGLAPRARLHVLA